MDVRSGYKNTDRKDVRTFFKTFFRGFFLPKFQIFCQCSDFLSIGYYHKQANTFCCYHFSPSSASVLISCQMVVIISKRYLLLPINSVSDTFYRRSYYVLLPRPFMTDMFCSDTFCSAIRFVAICFVPIRVVGRPKIWLKIRKMCLAFSYVNVPVYRLYLSTVCSVYRWYCLPFVPVYSLYLSIVCVSTVCVSIVCTVYRLCVYRWF